MLSLGRDDQHQLYASYMGKNLTLRGKTVILGIEKMYESFEKMMKEKYPGKSDGVIRKGFVTCVLGAKKMIVDEKVKETEQARDRLGGVKNTEKKGVGRDDE